MAVANYHDAHGCYPPPYLAGHDGRPWHSWRVLLLPYLEQSPLYEEYDFAEPWDGPKNRRLAARMPEVYAFHDSHVEGNTTTNYLAVVGEETAWPGVRSVASGDVTDALGATILLVENLGADVHWMEPRDLSLPGMDLRWNCAAGVSSPYDEPAVVMLDASLHRLQKDLKPATLRALLTIGGGEALADHEARGWELLPDGRRRSRPGS